MEKTSKKPPAVVVERIGMTKEAALAKARELWGDRGDVFDRFAPENAKAFEGFKGRRYWVGNTAGYELQCDDEGCVITDWIYGNGDTWEEAFDNLVYPQTD